MYENHSRSDNLTPGDNKYLVYMVLLFNIL